MMVNVLITYNLSHGIFLAIFQRIVFVGYHSIIANFELSHLSIKKTLVTCHRLVENIFCKLSSETLGETYVYSFS